MPTSYDRLPTIHIGAEPKICLEGHEEVSRAIEAAIAAAQSRVVLEFYPGVLAGPFIDALRQAIPRAVFIDTSGLFKNPEALKQQFAATLGSDPVFGFMQPWTIEAYFELEKLNAARESVRRHDGVAVVFGTGASRVVESPDLLVYLSTTRWVLQHRQRAHEIGNLGLDNAAEPPTTLYKNAFFLDWRVGDVIRHQLFGRIDWFVDLDDPDVPRMLPGSLLRASIKKVVQRPFRVVPFFDPGPWGGQWMRKRFGLPEDAPNYAWAFDCVPEENGVLLEFGEQALQPARAGPGG